MAYKRGDFGAFAVYETANVPTNAAETGETRSIEELVHDSTAAQIDFLVESGELTGEQVYEAEKAGKGRKTVLAKYEPEAAPAATPPLSEEGSVDA